MLKYSKYHDHIISFWQAFDVAKKVSTPSRVIITILSKAFVLGNLILFKKSVIIDIDMTGVI